MGSWGWGYNWKDIHKFWWGSEPKYAYKRYAYNKSVLFHLLVLLLVFDSILFCLFVNNLILFCLFVDAGQKEGLQGFECKRSLCSAVEETLRLNVDILR